jgi:hypothetical protein
MTLRGVDKRTKRELKREKQKNEKRRAREGSQNYYVLYIVRCLKQHIMSKKGGTMYIVCIFSIVSVSRKRELIINSFKTEELEKEKKAYLFSSSKASSFK